MVAADPRAGHLWRPYTQMQTEAPPLVAVETEGARIRLADGRWLIDGIASWWTACHGYNHPHIMTAMHRQLDAMPHVMFGGFTHEPALALGERLAGILPGSGTDAALEHVFFCDSGSVAVEIALKMAVQYWRNKGETNRCRFVAFRDGYHGDTMGAMAVCDPDDGMHALFSGYFPEQIFVDVPRNSAALADFESVLAQRRDEIAAVIIEPLVQGAGGMKFHDEEILAAIRAACARQHVLFIADEIATGFGRTGTLFACEAAETVPDIICIGKALSGGAVSLAATIANRRVFDSFLGDDDDRALMHGPTYMANPLACAAANASLDLFEDDERLRQVASLETYFRSALAPCRSLDGIADVRVKGAIGVVQMTRPGHLAWLRQRFIEEGVWVRPFGDIVYLMPPFVVTNEQRAALGDAVVTVMSEWSKKSG
jgi:adenosylmethionine-8-amino-7-oxononanoate aminotransferase